MTSPRFPSVDTDGKLRTKHLPDAISLDKTADSATRLAMTTTERTKLAGVAAGATANATDAQLRDRSTHTGTQTSASISDLTEAVQDIVGAFFGAGTGASVTYNDAANTLTVSATGTSDPEVIRDTIGAALIGVGNISVVVNDAGDTITISTTATVNATDAALRDRSTHTGTETIAAMPAGVMLSVVQNGDGSWPNRRTSRTDVNQTWIKVVSGSADPAAATSPAVTGAYTGDVVVGV